MSSQTAIITGASGDIGRAVAIRCSAAGMALMLVGRDQAKLEQTRSMLQYPDTAAICIADVSNPHDVDHYVASTLDRFGKVDGFFNNAGYSGEVAPIGDYSIEIFDQVMATNVRGVWLGLRSVLPVMLRQGKGSVVVTSSMGGTKGFPGFSAYCASKHAEIGLMRTAAAEVGGFGVRVNSVNPGPIEGTMMRGIEFGVGDVAAAQEKFRAVVPMGRYGAPGEVAEVVYFLLSDASAYCSGGVYPVDGGVTAV